VNVTHVCACDILGGAAKAAYRVHSALRSIDVNSQMGVLYKVSNDPSVFPLVRQGSLEAVQALASKAAEKLFDKVVRPREVFANEWLTAPVRDLEQRFAPGSVLNLHWIKGVVSMQSVANLLKRRSGSLVWTLMDLGPITGGCHYPHGCMRYEAECGSCPCINSTRENDWSRNNLLCKRRALESIHLKVVAPNSWVRDRADASALFRNVPKVVIPLPIDLSTFAPGSRVEARRRLGIPDAARHVIFCAAQRMTEDRKGLRFAIEALRRLDGIVADRGSSSPNDIFVLSAGATDVFSDHPIPFKHIHVGMLNTDESLADAYRAADVFLCPSVEDAGPMMINESLACGTPVAAFATGGALDYVIDGRTGFVAPLRDSEGLANALLALLQAAANESSLGLSSRQFAQSTFDPGVIARRYRHLYEELRSHGC
jgi:glycosyltransferase involved in cell wall biosynthesis